MNGIVYSVVFFIIALGLLIAIHEYGHFWVARKLGVKVLRFSIGFGTPLWKRTRGPDQTEYVIAAIPLGGYVKMLDEREAPVEPHEQHRAFNRQSLKIRSAIVAAGPIANFIFAVLAYWLMFVLGVPGMKPLVGDVVPESALARAGVVRGDEIVSVAGRDTPTLESMRMGLVEAVLKGGTVPLEVRRDESVQALELDLAGTDANMVSKNLLEHLGYNPLRPHIDPVIDELVPDGAGALAGLKSGDRILSVDGQPMDDWSDWSNYVRDRPGKMLKVEIERAGRTQTIDVAPSRIEIDGAVIGRIGASPKIPEGIFERLQATENFGVLESAGRAVLKTWDMSVLTLRMLWKMLVGQASWDNISGPISMASYAGQTAQIGLVAFIAFLAIVSVSLGVLNLLPVPVLDGGHLMYYVVELFKGSPLSEQAQLTGQKVGIIILGGLMFVALFNDINRLIG